MDNFEIVVGIIIGGVFVFLGMVLKQRANKSNRNNVSVQEREIEKIMGNMLFLLAACVFVLTIALVLDKKGITVIAVIITFVISFVSYIHAISRKKK